MNIVEKCSFCHCCKVGVIMLCSQYHQSTFTNGSHVVSLINIHQIYNKRIPQPWKKNFEKFDIISNSCLMPSNIFYFKSQKRVTNSRNIYITTFKEINLFFVASPPFRFKSEMHFVIIWSQFFFNETYLQLSKLAMSGKKILSPNILIHPITVIRYKFVTIGIFNPILCKAISDELRFTKKSSEINFCNKITLSDFFFSIVWSHNVLLLHALWPLFDAIGRTEALFHKCRYDGYH
jgi:hypothetical protein